jgi:DNA-binding NtrC family response regulator
MTHPSILVVDDDLSIRETFLRQLAGEGYEIAAADSAETAIAMLGRHDIEPGLVITDLRMPGMGGLDLLRWLREAQPDVDVIVITAHEDMQTAITAMKDGAYEFLVKPLDLDQVELVIARCFRDRAVRRRMHMYKAEAAEPYELRRLIGRDPRMIEISKTIGSLATNRAAVLVRGETGTGKEVLARTIHYNSPAADEPFVAINCTAIPESLLESELFGHVRGSFTGAAGDRKGRFELAGSGTVFLDEIGDVSPAFQAKLLRVLQDGEFYPVGAERARRTAARVIAATHRPLEQLVRDGTFREDLYFRLRVVEIEIPPLRERRGDIRPIAEAMIARIRSELHKDVNIPEAVMSALERHDWPGNVRELENSLMRAAVLARTSAIAVEDLSLGSMRQLPGDKSADPTLAAAVLAHVEWALAGTGGNKRQAAKLLGISRQRLDRILARDVDAIQDNYGDETQPGSGPPQSD